MVLVKSAVLAFTASIVLMTVPSVIGWWQSPCPHFGDFPGKTAIGLAQGMQGCYYVTPSGDGVNVTVAYASRAKSLTHDVEDAKMIDAIMWNRLPFTIEQIVQYPNAFPPGDAATDKIVASQQDLAVWFGARPAGLDQASDIPLTTPLQFRQFAYPAGALFALIGAGLTAVVIWARRSRSVFVPAEA
jgi:hypothetical protein